MKYKTLYGEIVDVFGQYHATLSPTDLFGHARFGYPEFSTASYNRICDVKRQANSIAKAFGAAIVWEKED